jgi:hypothetical protein
VGCEPSKLRAMHAGLGLGFRVWGVGLASNEGLCAAAGADPSGFRHEDLKKKQGGTEWFSGTVSGITSCETHAIRCVRGGRQRRAREMYACAWMGKKQKIKNKKYLFETCETWVVRCVWGGWGGKGER